MYQNSPDSESGEQFFPNFRSTALPDSAEMEMAAWRDAHCPPPTDDELDEMWQAIERESA